MSLVSDLLSRVKQTGPRKDVPPGLTSSINAYKKKETYKKRTVFFAVVILASVLSGFASIYALRTLLGDGGEVRTTGPRYERTAERRAAVQESAAKPARQPAKVEELATPEKTFPDARKIQAGLKEIEKIPDKETRKSADKAGADDAAVHAPAKKDGRIDARDTAQLYYEALEHEKAGETLKAIGAYREALGSEPGNYRLMNKIASLFMDMKMWEEAGAHLRDAVSTKADYVPVLINSGIVNAETDRFDEAEGHLSKALSIEPLNRLALFNMALLCERRGRTEEANGYYRKLEQLGFPEGKKGLERMGGR